MEILNFILIRLLLINKFMILIIKTRKIYFCIKKARINHKLNYKLNIYLFKIRRIKRVLEREKKTEIKYF